MRNIRVSGRGTVLSAIHSEIKKLIAFDWTSYGTETLDTGIHEVNDPLSSFYIKLSVKYGQLAERVPEEKRFIVRIGKLSLELLWSAFDDRRFRLQGVGSSRRDDTKPITTSR